MADVRSLLILAFFVAIVGGVIAAILGMIFGALVVTGFGALLTIGIALVLLFVVKMQTEFDDLNIFDVIVLLLLVVFIGSIIVMVLGPFIPGIENWILSASNIMPTGLGFVTALALTFVYVGLAILIGTKSGLVDS